jgi:benzodiazapine receptor
MRKVWLLFTSVAIAEIAGVIGSFFTVSSINGWYQYLVKPSFNPPNYLFAPVWTILYALMGMALYLVIRDGWDKKRVKAASVLYGIQLALNAVWSIIFFGLRSPFWALIDIGILWALIIFLIPLFYKVNKLSAYLLVPYLVWVSFASVLNFSIWQLN